MSETTQSTKHRRRLVSSVPAGSFPLTPDAIRQGVLEAAGFTRDAQIELTKKVVTKIDEALDAKKEVVIQDKHGGVTQVSVPDNTAQAKARDQALDLLGVRAPRTNATSVIKTVVTIDWPDWARPKDITPPPE